ncbi:glycerol-3-phosphate 1-O-acyltransferase PlsY [Halocynthiibacter sp. C4]|uniref:glycerol-3-phosphate 1-O-acyltransferase PlsY n=1 Tax=Halocynthiibacter sp. C4 TaxID=2992758 RepID=UPI00237A4B88|nr:glycerol-3-phosphate 1-O-acyltransferase PlsY [Halocynthiibacter sp. C4]MDE0590835.1 glycerol-3-phosphate 1-O-acyltransferase PlsY [Halocynthiibacter sp. C4]
MSLFEVPTEVFMLAAIMGYLLGSIPSGVLLARVMGLGNLREIGSGNIGATNVLRTGNKKAAALTLLFDAAKGAIAVLIARELWGENAAQIAALAAFLGHCFPVWLGFKGGKGVATFLGIMLALSWQIGLAACATWLFFAFALRYSSLAALMAAGLSPLWMVVLQKGELFFLGMIFAILIYWRHWENIHRLRAGTEPKIGKK